MYFTQEYKFCPAYSTMAEHKDKNNWKKINLLIVQLKLIKFKFYYSTRFDKSCQFEGFSLDCMEEKFLFVIVTKNLMY